MPSCQEVDQAAKLESWSIRKRVLTARMLYSGVASGVASFFSFLLSICGGPRLWEPELSVLYVARIGVYGITAMFIAVNTLYIVKLSRLFDEINIGQM